jgi:hypothetical protein
MELELDRVVQLPGGGTATLRNAPAESLPAPTLKRRDDLVERFALAKQEAEKAEEAAWDAESAVAEAEFAVSDAAVARAQEIVAGGKRGNAGRILDWKEEEKLLAATNATAVQEVRKVAGWLDATIANVGGSTAEMTRARVVTNEAYARARYTPLSKSLDVPPDPSDADIIHELGHHIENEYPAIAARARAYLDYRTQGETPVPLAGLVAYGSEMYSPQEVATPDKFINPYVGKRYASGDTEVISMGLQLLYRDPVGLALKDPGLFDFITSVLKEVGR